MKLLLGLLLINQVMANEFSFNEWKNSFEEGITTINYEFTELTNSNKIEQDCMISNNTLTDNCLKNIKLMENSISAYKSKFDKLTLDEGNKLKILENKIKTSNPPDYSSVKDEMKNKKVEYLKTQKYQYELYVSNYYKSSKKHVEHLFEIINNANIKFICSLSKNDEIKQKDLLEQSCLNLRQLKKEYNGSYNIYLDQFYHQDFIIEDNNEFDTEFQKKSRLIPSIYDFVQFHEKVDVRRSTLQSWMISEDEE